MQKVEEQPWGEWEWWGWGGPRRGGEQVKLVCVAMSCAKNFVSSLSVSLSLSLSVASLRLFSLSK